MDRQWIYLLAFFYVLLALPVVISAESGARLDVLLDFSTLYLVAWTLIVVWWYGEHIASSLRSEKSPGTAPDKGEAGAAGAASDKAQRLSMETPRLVRIALDEAAKKLANLGIGTPSGTAAPAASRRPRVRHRTLRFSQRLPVRRPPTQPSHGRFWWLTHQPPLGNWSSEPSPRCRLRRTETPASSGSPREEYGSS
jgi:hypothetical protein